MSIESWIKLEATLLRDVSLKPYNSLRLESSVALMIFPHTMDGLVQVMKEYQDTKKIFVIGKGSNTLFKQTYYDESTLFINLKFLDYMEIQKDEIYVQCGATLSDLVWFGIENSRSGLEFMEDIPGTVGGAILMNAGTYRNYIGDLITSVTYYDFDSQEVITRKKQPNDFGRRQSFWSNKQSILLSCTIDAQRGDYLEALEEVQRIKKDRFSKQPRNFPSAGSVFVRPKVDLKDMVVWELLDKVGLRGLSHGEAAFSEKHPGFIINLGDATYDDINYLIKLAQTKVKNEFNVDLTVEWKTL